MDLPSSIFQDPSLDERGRSEISHDASLGILSACLACIDLPRDFGAGESADNYDNLYANSRRISVYIYNQNPRKISIFENTCYLNDRWR